MHLVRLQNTYYGVDLLCKRILPHDPDASAVPQLELAVRNEMVVYALSTRAVAFICKKSSMLQTSM